MSIGKTGHAQATWQEGVDRITDFCDADIALNVIANLEALKSSVVSKPDPAAEKKSDSISNPIVAAPSSVETSPMPLYKQRPTVERPESTSHQESSGAADAIAALGGKDRKVGIEQLQIIENHFIGFQPNQIHPDIIKVSLDRKSYCFFKLKQW